MGSRRRLDHLPGEDPHTGTEGIFFAAFTGCEREIRDHADSVQCFTAKAQSSRNTYVATLVERSSQFVMLVRANSE
jgi:hypothetical protein